MGYIRHYEISFEFFLLNKGNLGRIMIDGDFIEMPFPLQNLHIVTFLKDYHHPKFTFYSFDDIALYFEDMARYRILVHEYLGWKNGLRLHT